MFGKKKDKLSKEKQELVNEATLPKNEVKEEQKYKYVEDDNKYKVNEKPVRNPMLGARFWFFCLGAAILLTLGIWILLDKSLGSKLSIGVTGAVIFLLGILRFIPLFKGTKNKKTKLSILGEITIELLIGGFLFAVAFLMQKNGPTAMSDFVSKYYKYFLGAILYLKAVFYFINTSLLGEDTYKMEFWTHILCITLACVVFALNFNASSLGLLVGILCLLSGLAVGASSGSSYFNYHKNNKKNKPVKEKNKKKTKEEDKTIILPQIEEENEEVIVQ